MLYFKDQFAVIWEVQKVEERYSKVRLGTSEKDQEGNYVNSNWFTTFLGNAHKSVTTLSAKDRVKITGKVTNVSKKQDDGTFKTYMNVVVHSFQKSDPPSGSGMDTPPVVDNSDDEVPF